MIETLGIYELRNYARAVGVRSPSTKRRQQLLDEIEEIESGKSKPCRLRLGRKPKEFGKDKFPSEIACMQTVLQKYEILSMGIKELYEKVKQLDK